MSRRKAKRAILWNVQGGNLESVHESKEGAEQAERRFLAKTGSNLDDTALEVIEFEVSLPEPRTLEDVQANEDLEKRRQENLRKAERDAKAKA